MAKANFLKIINYLQGLGEKHVDIKETFRWNVVEVNGAMRQVVGLPFMAVDPVETKPKGGGSLPVIDYHKVALSLIHI